MAVLKPCPKCKNLIPAGLPMCAACAPAVMQAREEYRQENQRKKAALYNRRRDTKYTTFYRSKEWRMTSKVILQNAGYKCDLCGGLAVEVHHIKPIQTAEGWETRLDAAGLQALCTACHNIAHDGRRKKAPSEVLDMRDIMRNI